MSDLDRREFLLRSGRVAGALGFLPTLANTGFGQEDPAPQPEGGADRGAAPEKAFRKGVRFEMLDEELTVGERFQLLKEMGFEGVEIESPVGAGRRLKPAEIISLREELKTAREETGLVIHGIVNRRGTLAPLTHPDQMTRRRGFSYLANAIADAKILGATTVRQPVGVVSKEIAYDDAYLRVHEEVRKLLPLAERAEIRIAFENGRSPFLLSPREFARFLDEFDSKQVAISLNVGNVQAHGWPRHWIEILGAWIAAVHVTDYSRARRDQEGYPKGFEVDLLEGDTDWPEVLTALRSVGFRGWLTADVPGGPAERLLQVSGQMDAILGR